MPHTCFFKGCVYNASTLGPYTEVEDENNTAHYVKPNVLGIDTDLLEMYILFATDTVNHNIIIIIGNGTFHEMGVITSITPGTRTNYLITRKQTSELNTYIRQKFLSLRTGWQGILS